MIIKTNLTLTNNCPNNGAHYNVLFILLNNLTFLQLFIP